MNNPITLNHLITSTVAELHVCCADTVMCVPLRIFEQFSANARTPARLMPSSGQILTQNDHSRSFKVIRFGVNEESLTGYIVQYNNCGLECEGSEDIVSERSENRHLRPPLSFDAPSLANPREYTHKSYLARN